jgi:Peptidase family S41
MDCGLKAICLPVIAFLSLAAAPVWNPALWIADLDQLRMAIDHSYPNRDWLTGQREVSLDRWFNRAADAIRQGSNDADARRALDSLIERFNDGHVVLHWPSTASAENPTDPEMASPARPNTIETFCAARGYDAEQVTVGTAASLPGYQPIDSGGAFAAGTVQVGDYKIGVVRLGVFSPQGYPTFCRRAVISTRTPLNKPCDDACDDRVLTEAYALMTHDLIKAVEALQAAGAQVLLIDLTRNGGGTEWSEAAARILSPVPLRSAQIRVIRNNNWVKRWSALAMKLRREAESGRPEDQTILLDSAKRADAIANEVKPCANSSCPLLAPAGFASGLFPELPAGRLDGRKWESEIFSPAQFPYRDSVWKGPSIVLVDDQTWSAAEQFAALMQDNNAAVVMGTRTGGAGCGHLDGNDALTLFHSGAKLELPNCARFRKDGSNEVGGIVPDIPTGVRWNDGASYAGQITATRLPDAIRHAQALLRNQPPR